MILSPAVRQMANPSMGTVKCLHEGDSIVIENILARVVNVEIDINENRDGAFVKHEALLDSPQEGNIVLQEIRAYGRKRISKNGGPFERTNPPKLAG